MTTGAVASAQAEFDKRSRVEPDFPGNAANLRDGWMEGGEMETMMPAIGTKLTAFFGAKKYTATVVRHGRKYPIIQFKLKNGRLVEGPATILPYGVSTGVTYRGYLAQMFHPTAYN